MTPEIRRTLLVDALIVAMLVALALILAPGYAIIGLFALLALLLIAITSLVGRLRSRRRRRRVDAVRRARLAASSAYGPAGAATTERPNHSAPRTPAGPDWTQVRRVPAGRRAQTRRKPPGWE